MPKKKGSRGKTNGFNVDLSDKDAETINKFISNIIENATRDITKAGPQAEVPIVFGFNFQVDSMPIHTSYPGEQHINAPKLGEPLIDIIESKGGIDVIAEMPGTKQDEIEVTSSGDNLMITSKSASRPYMRTIKLPRQIKKGSITFNYRNGVIEVHAAT